MNYSNSFIYFLLYCIAVFLLVSMAPMDGDVWWQMEYGRKILETGSLYVDHTQYSWTKSSNTILYVSWIGQVVLYLIHEQFGLTGLAVFRAAVLTLPMLLTWGLICIGGGQAKAWHFALGFLVFYLSKFSGGLIKPELFGYLFFSLLTFAYFLVKTDTDLKHKKSIIYAIPVIILLWINAHGTFIIGLVVLGTILVGEFINTRASRSIQLHEDLWKPIYLILPLTALALLLNPHGFNYLVQVFVFRFSTDNSEHFNNIFAYQSIFREQLSHLHIREGFVFIGTIWLLLSLESIRKKRFDVSIFLVNVLLLVLANGWGRTSYFSPIFMLATIGYLSLNSSVGKVEFKKLQTAITVLVTLPIALYASVKLEDSFKSDTAGSYLFEGYLNPAASARFYETHFPKERFCNGYNGGGYLLWRYADEKKVMIDPRFFPYKEWYSLWIEMKLGKNINTHIDSLNCTVWILNHTYGNILRGLSAHESWKLVFVGRSSAVYIDTSKIDFDAEMELEPALGEVNNLTQSAKILNTLLRNGSYEEAVGLAKQIQMRWRDTKNHDKAQRAYEFARGNKLYFDGKDEMSFAYLKSAHDGDSVISNTGRLTAAGVFALQSYHAKKDYQQAYDTAKFLKELHPESPMHNFNYALLSRLIQKDNLSEQNASLEIVTATKDENKEGLPVKYFDIAESLLAGGSANNIAPLKINDSRTN